MIQEINWSKIKRLVTKGVTGLALAMVLMGAAPGTAMANTPPPCRGEAGVCQVDLGVQWDTEEVKKELAELVQKWVQDGGSAEDAEDFGWKSDWGNYKDYLQKDVTKEHMKLTKQQLKRIIREEYARTLAEGDVPRHRVPYREYQHLLDGMMGPTAAIVSKHGLEAALFVIDAAVEELKDQFTIKADNPYA